MAIVELFFYFDLSAVNGKQWRDENPYNRREWRPLNE